MNANTNESKCPFLRTVMPYYNRANACMNDAKPYALMVTKAFRIYVNTFTMFLQQPGYVRQYKHVLIILVAILIIRFLL